MSFQINSGSLVTLVHPLWTGCALMFWGIEAPGIFCELQTSPDSPSRRDGEKMMTEFSFLGEIFLSSWLVFAAYDELHEKRRKGPHGAQYILLAITASFTQQLKFQVSRAGDVLPCCTYIFYKIVGPNFQERGTSRRKELSRSHRRESRADFLRISEKNTYNGVVPPPR